MAVMIPETPRSYDPASREDAIFDALKALPDDYCVFHSMSITSVNKDNTLSEREIDFVIYNRHKGIICLESKAGQIRYENGCWLYGDGTPMAHDGPFKQAQSSKFILMNYIAEKGHRDIVSRCRVYSAVWFPTVSRARINSMALPPDADRNMLLSKEALGDPLTYIEKIYDIVLPSGVNTKLTEKDHEILLREILCPSFDIIPPASFDADIKKLVFKRLLKEQAAILDFLQEQRTAVINGAAGTGKTMIAVEKARRHACAGDRVLFLCYNKMLREHLNSENHSELVDYYTLDGFACRMCNTSEADYQRLDEVLLEMLEHNSFPYKHIIIDEGQDFGFKDVEEAQILETLKFIVNEGEDDSRTFYVFYDKLQLVQAREIPAVIRDADCKLTLYRNCRNTENIAKTSSRPVKEYNKLRLMEGCVKGVPASLLYCGDDKQIVSGVRNAVKKLHEADIRDIVILTCKTENGSVLSSYVKDGKFDSKIKFTTCRKFKGLEADAVILVDVDKSIFSDNDVLRFYVGTSRARLRLEIISSLSDEDCKEILCNVFGKEAGKIRRAQKELADCLCAVGSKAGQ